jgi:hypothetical protein
MSEKGFFEYPFNPGDKVVMVKNYNHEIGTVKKCYGASGFLTLTKIPYSCDIVFADKREKIFPGIVLYLKKNSELVDMYIIMEENPENPENPRNLRNLENLENIRI